MYLENPVPLPLYHSPQLTWKDDEDSAKMDQVRGVPSCERLRTPVLTARVMLLAVCMWCVFVWLSLPGRSRCQYPVRCGAVLQLSAR